jgi:glycosyltransferase involved in cell wall biosynthesis
VGRFTLANVLHTLRLFAALVRELWTFHPDVVHIPVNSNPTALLRCRLFALAARLSGGRVVMHVHGGLFADRYLLARGAWRSFMRGTMRLGDTIVCLSPAWQRFFDGLALGRRTAVVFNPVDPELLHALDTARAVHHPRVRVLFVGPLARAKGVHELLESLRVVMDARSNVEAHIVGGELCADEAAEIRALHAAHPHRERIFLRGPRSGAPLAQEYAEADVLVLPSYGEGVPLVVLDAMAAGCPVVATPVGGIPDVVRDGVNGLIVPPRDAPALAGAIAHLVEDKRLRRRMGLVNRVTARRHYTARRFADSCDRVYRSLIETAPIRRTASGAPRHASWRSARASVARARRA